MEQALDCPKSDRPMLQFDKDCQLDTWKQGTLSLVDQEISCVCFSGRFEHLILISMTFCKLK